MKQAFMFLSIVMLGSVSYSMEPGIQACVKATEKYHFDSRDTYLLACIEKNICKISFDDCVSVSLTMHFTQNTIGAQKICADLENQRVEAGCK